MLEKKEFIMPAEFEVFRDLIMNTGGNPIEGIMNDHTTTVFNNAPRALICVAVKSQIDLLAALHEKGFLSLPNLEIKKPEEIEYLIGTLKEKCISMKGFITPEIGHHVFTRKDKYVVYFVSERDTSLTDVTYNPHTLESKIDYFKLQKLT